MPLADIAQARIEGVAGAVADEVDGDHHQDNRGRRPEQVARALGVEGPPTRVHRTRLELHEPEVARAT